MVFNISIAFPRVVLTAQSIIQYTCSSHKFHSANKTGHHIQLPVTKLHYSSVKVELAAAQRKMTDELKKYKDTIDAKDIELKNWFVQ